MTTGKKGPGDIGLILGADTTQLQGAENDLDNLAKKFEGTAQRIDASTEKVKQAAKSTAETINKYEQSTAPGANEEFTKAAHAKYEALVKSKLAAEEAAKAQAGLNTAMQGASSTAQEALRAYQAQIDGLTKLGLSYKEATALVQKRQLEEATMRGRASKEEQDEWNALIRQYEKYNQDRIALAQKREKEEHDIRTRSAREESDQWTRALAELEKQEAARAKIQQSRDMQTREAQLRYEKEANAALAAESKAIATAEAHAIASAEKKALAEIAWSNKSLEAKIAHLVELQKWQSNSAITPATIEGKFGSAALGDLQNLAKYQREYAEAAKMAALASQQGSHHANSLSEALGLVNFNSSRARSELIVLAHEAVQGRFSRMGPSMMVLGEYTNMAALAFSAAGVAIIGTVAALGLLAYEMGKGVTEQMQFNKAMVLTHNFSGQTEASLLNLSDTLRTQTNVSIGKSTEMMYALADSGKFSAVSLESVGRAALDLQRLTGDSVETIVKDFSGMAKMHGRIYDGMTNTTADWAARANEKYKFLSAEIYEHVKQLAAQGKQQEAIKIISDELHESLTRQEVKVGALTHVYRGLVFIMSEVGHWMMELGKDWFGAVDPAEELAKQEEKVNKAMDKYVQAKNARKLPNGMTVGGSAADIAAAKEALDKEYKVVGEMRDKINKQIADKQRDAETAELNSRGVAAQRSLDQLDVENRTRAQKREIEIKRLKQNVEDVNASNIRAWEDKYRGDKANMEKDRQLAIANGELKIKGEEYIAERIAMINKKHADPKGSKGKEFADGSKQDLDAMLQAANAAYKLTEDAGKAQIDLVKRDMDSYVQTKENGYEKIAQIRDNEAMAIEKNYVQQIAALEAFDTKGNQVEEARIRKLKEKVQQEYDLRAQQLANARTKDAQDENNFGVKKVQGLTDQNIVDASKINEATEAMTKYGKAGRATNVELTDLQITKSGLNKATQAEVVNAARASAAAKDLAQAYKNLADIQLELAKEGPSPIEGVLGVEQAKVAIWQDSMTKRIDFEVEVATAAINIQRSSGAITEEEAQARLNRLSAAVAKTRASFATLSTVKFEVAGLKDVGTMFDRVGAAFGKMGDSFRGFQTGLQGIGKGFETLAKIQEDSFKTGKDGTAEQIGAYGDMADSAKNFFSEGSAGYKTLEGAAKIAHTAQVAMNLIEMGQLAVKAVMSQAGGDPYSAWIRMAAMAAAMAALGFAVGGGFNSGGGESPMAADIQKTQGSGTTFGDATAISKSIDNSIKELEKSSKELLPVNREMLASLRNIESSMVGFTNLLARTNGVVNGTNLGIQEGTISQGTKIGQAISGALNSTIGTILSFATGGLLAVIGNKVFGALDKLWGKTTQTITDSGVTYGGKLTDLQSGKGYNQYANVATTTSSLFGLIKDTDNSVVKQSLTTELSNQFAKIFTSMGNSLQQAGVLLGGTADEVKAKLDNLVLAEDKVSLKGLTGDALTKQLNALISKTLDQMAEATFPKMDEFRQVGEGLAETVIRVANTFATTNQVFSKLGMVMYNNSDVGIRWSVAFADMMGGLEGFLNITNKYYDQFFTKTERDVYTQNMLSKEFEKQGIFALGLTTTLPKTREEYRKLVEYTQKWGTQEQLAIVLQLSDAFASFTAEVKDTTAAVRTEADILQERVGLQDQLNALTLTEAQLLKLAKDKIDESNKSLFDAVQVATALKEAKDKENSLNNDIKSQIDALTKSNMTLTEVRAMETKGQTAATVALYNQLYALQDETAARQKALDIAKQQRALNIELLKAQGKTAEATAKEREDILAGQDKSLHSTQKAIWAAQDKTAAEEKQAAADKKAADDAKTASDKAIADAKAAADATAKAMKDARDAYDKAVSDAKSKLKDAYERESSALQEIIDKMHSFTEAARKMIDSLRFGDGSVNDTATKYKAAKQELPEWLAKARGGDEASLEKLQQFVDLSKASSKSLDEYTADVATVMDVLSGAADSTERQENIAKAQLAAMKKEVDALLDVNTSVLTVAEAIRELQRVTGSGFNALAAATQGQYNADHPAQAKTFSTGESGLQAQGYGQGSRQQVIADTYAKYRDSENAAAKQYKDAIEKGFKGTESDYFDKVGGRFNIDEMLAKALAEYDASKQSTVSAYVEAQAKAGTTVDRNSVIVGNDGVARLPSFDIGTDYVPFDMTARIHEGEKIIPKRFNPDAGGTSVASQQAAINDKLEQGLSNVRIAVEAVALNTAKINNKLERVIVDDHVTTKEAV